MVIASKFSISLYQYLPIKSMAKIGILALLKEHQSSFLKTWYVAFGALVLQKVLNDEP